MRKKEKKLTIHTKTGAYQVLLWWDVKDKAYLVKVPSLPGVVTFGKTLASTKKMAKDAIELHCECLLDEKKIIIDDKERIIGKVSKGHRVLAPVA